MRFFRIVLAALPLVALPKLALAQGGAAAACTSTKPAAPEPTLGPDAPPAADQRYRIGRQLYREGRFAAAANEFKAALAMYPRSSKLAFNLARSQERAGDLGGAIEHYRLYLELAPAAEDRAEIEALVPTLRARLEAAWPRVAIVTHPGGARVLVDGRDAPDAPRTPVTLRLPPGPHALRFVLDGHRTEDRLVELKADTPVEVTLTREVPVVEAVEPVEWRPWAGYGAIALGVATAGVGLLGHVQSSATADEAASVRPGPEGDRRYDRLQDDYDGQRLMMGIGYGVGAALVAAGVAVLLWPDDPPPDGAALTVRF